MIDEFQDTNAVQLGILEALERDNLFAVGDEFQSIYRFRHADVGIFRARAAALGADRVRTLAVNFRSREELLDVLNAAFAPELGGRFTPLRAGRRPEGPGGELRLFDLAPTGEPPVEFLITDTHAWDEFPIGLEAGGDQPWRRAEARLIAHRLRTEVDGGRRPGEVVVLVRATSSLRLLEEALEEQGLPTYVVGGRGYWSQEQVRDGLAWLRALANPHDEEAVLTVLASPFCGAGTDDLILLAQAARAHGGPVAGAARRGWRGCRRVSAIVAITRLLASERDRAERAPLEVLLERAIVATGYDLAVLARPGGDRRLANLRKLMRLAREFERSEGRDLRGFLADAAARDLAEAREGEAALESEGLDAVRLMTIHRAKGLEFPVVCVADLGRGSGGRRAAAAGGRGRHSGPAARAAGRRGHRADRGLAAARERRGRRRGRGGAAAVLRRAHPRPRAADPVRRHGHVEVARSPPGRPADRLDRAGRARRPDLRAGARRPPGRGRAGARRRGGVAAAGAAAAGVAAADAPRDRAAPAPAPPEPVAIIERDWDGRLARVACRLNTPETLPKEALLTRTPARVASSTALPATPVSVPAAPVRARPAPQRLSFTQLSDYGRCGYRFYLERVLRLPRVAPPIPADEAAPQGVDPLTRGSLVHRALEALDFAHPQAPDADTLRGYGVELSDDDIDDIQDLVERFARSALCARLANAKTRKEAGFSFALDSDGSGPLVSGFVDVIATEPDGTVLVVDYKSHKLAEETDTHELIERDYTAQRLVYALAALRNGAPRVEVAYCLLERPDEPIAVTYTQAQAPDLAGALSELARGVLAHEYPVTPTPHRELCGDCPGRKALCSYREEETLRSLSDFDRAAGKG